MTIADVAMRDYAENATLLRLTADQLAVEGFPALARQHRLWAAIATRARRAELTDPEPVDRPWCVCESCQSWLFDAHWKRIA